MFFILFLTATVLFFVGPELIFGADCTKGARTFFIDDLYNTSQQAYATFCRSNCGCAVENTSDLYRQLKSSGLNTSGTAIKYMDCANVTASVEFTETLAAL